MSQTKFPKIDKIDGMTFLGGGVRCATHQLPPICLAMFKLGLTFEQLVRDVKYFGANSGGTFTATALLCYRKTYNPQTKKLEFPLNEIPNYVADKSGKLPVSLVNFYKPYWIDPISSQFVNEKTNEFLFGEALDIGMFTWVNGLGILALMPFAKWMANMKIKDMPLPKDHKKIVAFGATVLQNSNIRQVPDNYNIAVKYSWKRETPPIEDIGHGYPINLFYGFGNKQVVPKAPFFPSGGMGTITYTKIKTPGKSNENPKMNALPPIPNIPPYYLKEYSKCLSASTKDNPVDDGPDTTVSNLKNLDIGTSKFGESLYLSFVAASSSFTGCSNNNDNTGYPNGLQTAQEFNMVFFDQPVIFDTSSGMLVTNSRGTLPDSFPIPPCKDNGSIPSLKTPPSYLNLCDGTVAYDNTGITSMLVAMQAHENPNDLQNKTYNLVHFDGPDTSDDQTIPSSNHFARLFKNDNNDKYGRLTIFDKKVTAFSQQFESNTNPNVIFFWYPGLKTVDNEFVGIKGGTTLNLLVFCPFTKLGTNFQSFQDLQNHISVNQQLLTIYNDMDNDLGWISSIFPQPQKGQYTCVVEGGNPAECVQCVVGQSGCNPLAVCKASCPPPAPKHSSSNETVLIVVVVVIVVVVLAAIGTGVGVYLSRRRR